MNSLLLSMPGAPIIYYGDEIGMGDNFFLGDRNGVRTPMQWSLDRNAGFSRADPQQLFLPPIMDPIYGFEAVNVEAQHARPLLAVELDEAHAPGAQDLAGLWPRHPEVHPPRQPQSAGVSAPVRRRHHSLRRESVALGATGRNRSRGSQGHRADRAAGQHAVSTYRRAAVFSDSPGVRLLLVPSQPGSAGPAVARRAYGAGRPACARAGGGLEQLLPGARRCLALEPRHPAAGAARNQRHSAIRRGPALVRRQGRAHCQRAARPTMARARIRSSAGSSRFSQSRAQTKPTSTSSRSPSPIEDGEESRWKKLQPAAIARVRQQATVGVLADACVDENFCRVVVDAIGSATGAGDRVRSHPFLGDQLVSASCVAIPTSS